MTDSAFQPPAKADSRTAYVIHDEAADTYTMKVKTYRSFMWLGLSCGVVMGFVLGMTVALLLVERFGVWWR